MGATAQPEIFSAASPLGRPTEQANQVLAGTVDIALGLRGAEGPGHEVIVPDAATMAQWREGLRPVSERYLGELSRKGFPDARAAYERMLKRLGR